MNLDWLSTILHIIYGPPAKREGRRLAAVADRLNRQTDTVAAVLHSITDRFEP